MIIRFYKVFLKRSISRLLGLLSIIFLCSPVLVLANNQITDVQIKKISAEHMRVILQLAYVSDIKSFQLRNPNRYIVDIKETDKKKQFKLRFPKNDLLTKVRFGSYENNLRMVFDIGPTAQGRISTKFLPQDKVLLLVDFTESAGKTVSKTPKPVVQADLMQKRHKLVVVIDPGHGGKDPGAIGANGIHEKKVVLAIAKKLAVLINKQPGMRAVLTRNDDRYISLRRRLDIARRNKADIFVAIHADAFNNNVSQGASVYALSLRGASSEAARWLAAKENYSELGEVNLTGKNDVLRSVLIDLSQTATITSSLSLGNGILQHLEGTGKLHHNRVEQAAFVVLKSPDIPSVLIETGFISNPNDEKNLINPVYQRKLAQAVLSGIEHYFNQRSV